MAFNSGQGSRLLAPGIRNVIFQAYREKATVYDKIFNVKTSKRAYEEDLEFVGLGIMTEQPEGESVTYTTPTQGELKRYTHVSFGGAFRITRQMKDDDLYGIVNGRAGKMARELGKGARAIRETRAANVFNNGFTVADGFPKNGTQETLFNTAHTQLMGPSVSNRGAVDLSQAALEAAIIAFRKLTDENGIPIVVMPEQLIVPPELIMVARELLGSEYRPYEANNTINPTRADRLSMQDWNYLTDTDAWFVAAAKGDHDLNFIVRTDLEYEYSDDFDTGDMKNKAFQRFSVGHGDWRGVYGSPGV